MSRNINKVAIYLRQAYSGDGNDYLNKQQAMLVKICKEKGWKYTIYKEIASGSKIENRFQFKKLLNEIQENLYDAVIVADIYRLSRNLLDLEKVKGILASSDTSLYIGDTEMSLTRNNDDERSEEIKYLLSKYIGKNNVIMDIYNNLDLSIVKKDEMD
ncbi:recombinase family protein [Clostridium drakei]|uniref:Resolvase/invertase-type recombinase catalytic domain-containing protein n=1 Tax=Clostridium drakei TaxID=332101 RepID=A0A2U8DVK9_9CLOT|nr:recombinase family protein [Clostridium drakei]AWI06708.1 hypothetical protein B9W14_20155 [Clostridium drakei]